MHVAVSAEMIAQLKSVQLESVGHYAFIIIRNNFQSLFTILSILNSSGYLHKHFGVA
jgi:hypothetical protein